MKKLAAIPMLLLTIVALLYPVAVLALGADGYGVRLTYPTVVMAVVTVVTVLLSLLAISAKGGRFATLIAVLLPVLTALNCLFFVADWPTVPMIVLSAICLLSVVIASFSCCHGVISVILTLVMSLASAGLLGICSYHHFVSGSVDTVIPEPETVQVLPAPDGSCNAVARRDQYDGAVHILVSLEYADSPVNFIVGQLEHDFFVTSMLLEDFEANGMEWIDAQTLKCGGSVYAVSQRGCSQIETAAEPTAAPVEPKAVISFDPTPTPAAESAPEPTAAPTAKFGVRATADPEPAGAVVTEPVG